MLRATPQDRQKLELAVDNVLTLGKGKKFIFIHHSNFYRDQKFSKLQRMNFSEEVSDVLSGTPLCHKHGQWIYTEYGDGVSVFCLIHEKSGYTADLIMRLVAEGSASNMTEITLAHVKAESEDDDKEEPSEDKEAKELPVVRKTKGYYKKSRPLIADDESGW